MYTPETLALVAQLAPTAPAFRAMHLTHAVFLCSPQQQFMVRCRWRQLCKSPQACTWILPNQQLDGICMHNMSDADLGCDVCAYRNGVQWGTTLVYYNSGELYIRKTYICGKICGQLTIYYESGDVYIVDDYVDGVLMASCRYWKNGKLSYQAVFANEKRNGEEVYFTEIGHLYKRIVYEKDQEGKVVGKTIYDAVEMLWSGSD